ncbi:MAG: hypothetical protein QOF30_3185 [Acidimicrobiaceae bacterium]|jgi:hypothetical protein|nr:hypothetical protein [Acidimicrobiaceae bacterium]
MMVRQGLMVTVQQLLSVLLVWAGSISCRSGSEGIELRQVLDERHSRKS